MFHHHRPRPARRFSISEIEGCEARFLLSGVAPADVSSVSTASVRRLANLPYPSENGRKLKLDVYLPAGKAPPGGRPVVLALHGGGWRRYSKDEFGPRAAVLARSGYVVVAPNYTLSAPRKASWPANFQDVQAAVRWVRNNAARYGIDSGRVAAIGESAGGHLAELLGARSNRLDRSGSNLQAVVALAGPSDLITLGRESLQGAGLAASQMLGGSPSQLPRLYRDASPVFQVTPSSAPMLLIHGTNDLLVSPDQSAELDRVLRANGVGSVRLDVPAGHALTFQAGGRDLLRPILAFLKQSLG